MADRIEPTLSAADWATGVADIGPMARMDFKFISKLRIIVPGDTIDEDDAEVAQFSDPDDIAMVVAAANAALPDSDPLGRSRASGSRDFAFTRTRSGPHRRCTPRSSTAWPTPSNSTSLPSNA